MPKGRPYFQLRRFSRFTHRRKICTEDKANGVPFVRSGDFTIEGSINFNDLVYLKSEIHTTQLKSSQLKENDLLFAIVGATIGKVGVYKSDRPANINQAICAVRLKSHYNIDYINAYFQTKLGQSLIDRIKRPVARANVNLDEISTLPIILPTEEIQQKVISIFNNTLTQKQQNEAAAEKLLASIDDYLLKELGIHLPTPPENTLKNRMFTRTIKEIESRLDPHFYLTYFIEIEKAITNSPNKILRLDSIFEINRGGSPRPIHNFMTEDEKGLNWVKIGDTKNDNKYIYQTADKIIPEGAKYSRKVEIGDFILSNSMSFGRPYIMQIEGYIHDGWLLFKPKFEDFNADYFHSILSSQLMYKLFKKATIGGVVENLNIDLVKKIYIPVPPLSKQQEIAAHITAIRGQAQQLKDKAKIALAQANAAIEEILLG